MASSGGIGRHLRAGKDGVPGAQPRAGAHVIAPIPDVHHVLVRSFQQQRLQYLRRTVKLGRDSRSMATDSCCAGVWLSHGVMIGPTTAIYEMEIRGRGRTKVPIGALFHTMHNVVVIAGDMTDKSKIICSTMRVAAVMAPQQQGERLALPLHMLSGQMSSQPWST